LTLFDQEPPGRAPEDEPATDDAAPVPPPPPASAPAVRLRMTVAYDGTGYRGFAANRDVRTVGGDLAVAIAKVMGHEVALTCAGRTDAGVHAWGQVVHFDTEAAPDTVALHRSLNKMLAPAVVVRSVEVAPPGFDARRSATGRRYRYTVLNRLLPDPFLAATTWHVAEPLDVRSMALACDAVIGEHDWTSFCRRPPGTEPPAVAPSMVRVVRDARWLDLGEGLLRFDIEASAFCHQMVRSLTGTMVAVGKGRTRAGEMSSIIRAQDRSRAAEPAPPRGLCLWEVLYRTQVGADHP
jgi:tRNA pseudouridine38-40 synthase